MTIWLQFCTDCVDLMGWQLVSTPFHYPVTVPANRILLFINTAVCFECRESIVVFVRRGDRTWATEEIDDLFDEVALQEAN